MELWAQAPQPAETRPSNGGQRLRLCGVRPPSPPLHETRCLGKRQRGGPDKGAGLPAAERDRLVAQIGQVMRDPAMAAWCAENGLEPRPSSPDEFAAYMADETERFARFVKETGMRIE